MIYEVIINTTENVKIMYACAGFLQH